MIVNPDLGRDPNEDIVMRRATILHFDGTSEQALVQQPSASANTGTPAPAWWHRHLMVTYLLVGTIALTLSAYATIKMLQKSK